jgi:CDP-diacylglycerol---serine O-phosphatidyltransferase
MTAESNDAGESALTRRQRRLRRGVFLLPSACTVGNIFCGYYAIIATMHGDFDHAARAIGVAIVLDMLDGRIARMTHSATDFGLQLDSLADVVSFGIAPSILALVWGLSSLTHRLGWIAAFTFAICGTMRLARFNVQAGRFKHFVGLPIPAAGGAIAAIVHFFGDPVHTPVAATLMMGCVFLLSFLMVSTIRYSSMKHLALGKKSHLAILLLALLVALIYNYSGPALLAIAAAYCGSGIVGRIYGFLHRRRPTDELSLAESMEHH